MRPRFTLSLALVVCALLTSIGAAGSTRAAAPTTPAPASTSVGDVHANPQSLFSAANAKYFAGEYAEAARLYAEIVTRFQIEDAALYHNLGNAYFRSGGYGSSILYYERGLRLEPAAQLADAIDGNLAAARRTLQSRYRANNDEALVYADPSGVLYQISHIVGRLPLAILFLVIWAGFFALLVLRRVYSDARWPGRAAVPVGIAAAVVAFVLWGQVVSDADHRIGVVVSEGAKLRDGRHASAQGRDLPEGLEVKILDGDSDWTQVELASGRRGWVEATQVKQISKQKRMASDPNRDASLVGRSLVRPTTSRPPRSLPSRLA